MTYFSTHNHSSYSNAKVGLDSINRIDEMIRYANDINLAGLVLSDHEMLSGHVKFINEYKKLRDNGELNDGFKVGLGNEIYYCLENDLEELKENQANKNPDSQFFHFLLIAANANGHYQLRQLSSIAWENSWRDGLVERTPTFKKDLKRIINKGDVIATSACLGGAVPQFLLRMKQYKEENNSEKYAYCKNWLEEFIEDCIDIFGQEHFYLEIQPSDNEEQIYVNKEIIKLSKEAGLRYTVATDAHYLKKEDRASHKYYLLAQNIAREVDEFYDSTYIMSEDEVRLYLEKYLTDDEIQAAFNATMEIYDRLEFYDLHHDTVVPRPHISEEFTLEHKLEPAYQEYEYIEKFAYSPYIEDRYYWHLVQEGLIEKIIQERQADKEYFHQCLERVNLEFKELWLISERLGERMSAYYGLTREVVDEIWTNGDSIVGVARGSASGFFTNFLSGIVQISALDYDLPHFRHLTAERPELPDIDLDSEKSKRGKILQALIDKYGRRRVLNIATFTTEGSRSALLTAARGMQIDVSEVSYLTSLMPVERGFTWSLSDCFFGNKELGRKPVKELVNAVEKYENLKETALKIEGLIKSRSVHASGLYIFNDDYTTQNAMMKANNGQQTTQFDMADSDEMGGLKLDLLTVEGIDRIRTAMDLLVEHDYIEDQGSLRETYNHYLHPDKLEYDDEEMWQKAADNEIPDLFQFDTAVGSQCIKKSKPRTVDELASANSLMRLMAEDGGEQPIDKFVRHKENIQDWYDEMQSYNLMKHEIEVLEKHLSKAFGVSSSQEEMMLLLMDKDICGFSVTEANIARKVVGKKQMEKIPEIKDMVFSKGKSKALSKYIWDTQIMPQLGYSFSDLHSKSYSLIGLQEMNLAHLYPRVFWDTACLTVSAGAEEDSENNKSTDYGKISSSIGKMKRHVHIQTPLINQASFGFVPDVENNAIVFGLKGIQGINDETIRTIISNRPYTSFEDFYDRMYSLKHVTRKQMLMLIKAGAFNEFNSSVEVMKEFLVKETPVKNILNGQNMSRIISLGLFNNEKNRQYQEYFNFRNCLKKNVHERLTNPKNRVLAIKDEHSKLFFENNFSDESIYGFLDDWMLIDEKKFDIEYKEKMSPAMELLKDKEFIRKFNIAQFYELWNEFAVGTVESWYFEATSFYPEKHELEKASVDLYDLRNFSDLPEQPVVLGERKSKNGRVFQELELYNIVGTVLDKNKNSHSVTVLTREGDVVHVKTYAGAYAHYDRQIKSNGKIVEKSWFTRGELLMLSGFRRDDQFVLNAPKGQHTVNRITEIRDDGSLGLQSERFRV